MENMQIGATDEANVSRVVPTSHINIKIAKVGTPGHSDLFRNKAGSKSALSPLKKAIISTVDACMEISNNKELIKNLQQEKIKLLKKQRSGYNQFYKSCY